MANYKKRFPRTKAIIFRVTAWEKLLIEERAMRDGMDFSVWMRKKIGIIENSNV